MNITAGLVTRTDVVGIIEVSTFAVTYSGRPLCTLQVKSNEK